MCYATFRKASRPGVGWKIFIYDNGALYSTECAGPEAGIIRPERKWLRAVNSSLITTTNTRLYESGWSVFKRKKDAEKVCEELNKFRTKELYVVRKVKYKDTKYSGWVRWWGNKIRTKVVTANMLYIF